MRRLLVVVALIGLVSDALAGEFEMPTLRGASADYAPTPFVPAPPTFTALERLLCRRAGQRLYRRHRFRRRDADRWSPSLLRNSALENEHVIQLDQVLGQGDTAAEHRRLRRLQLSNGTMSSSASRPTTRALRWPSPLPIDARDRHRSTRVLPPATTAIIRDGRPATPRCRSPISLRCAPAPAGRRQLHALCDASASRSARADVNRSATVTAESDGYFRRHRHRCRSATPFTGAQITMNTRQSVDLWLVGRCSALDVMRDAERVRARRIRIRRVRAMSNASMRSINTGRPASASSSDAASAPAAASRRRESPFATLCRNPRLTAHALLPYVRRRDTPPHRGAPIWKDRAMAKRCPPCGRPCPHFSSGPCAKRPGWSLQALTDAVLGRSHRSKIGKAKLKRAIDLTREILEVPADYRIGIVPASDTGAVEMALWSLLGARPVTMLAWESFGEGWVTDVAKQLKLKDVTDPQGRLRRAARSRQGRFRDRRGVHLERHHLGRARAERRLDRGRPAGPDHLRRHLGLLRAAARFRRSSMS